MSNGNQPQPIIIKIEEGKEESGLEKGLLLLGLIGAGLVLPSVLGKTIKKPEVPPEEYKKVRLININIE